MHEKKIQLFNLCLYQPSGVLNGLLLPQINNDRCQGIKITVEYIQKYKGYLIRTRL